ncbi:MAG: tetratricopeptide repeat protein [Deltaproteobacteria bacterium]|nr:tetratricopeptide repeat protein [Deltaproteobacteria bacterium]
MTTRTDNLFILTVLLGALLIVPTTAAATQNWFEQGLAALKAKDYQAAVDKFTMAIEAVPDDFEALNNRGFARIYTGDYRGAIEDCSRSIAINPGSAKAYNNRGLARLFTGEFDDAIADFNQAIAINPRYVDAYSNRGLAWSQKEDYPRAIADCTEALHLNPRAAKALYSRGFARDRQGDPGGAMRDYIQVLKVNPGYIEAFNSMAWIMATSPDDRLRDGRRAVAYAEKAVDNSPPDINFLDTLAAAYAEAGRFDEAIAIENRIISLLAKARQPDAIPMHVNRMNHYEEGCPYRDPITIQSVSAVTDLQGELQAIDDLVFAPELTRVVYATPEAVQSMTAESSVKNDAPQPMLVAQTAPTSPVTVPEAFSQSIQTPPDTPVEITLNAEPDDNAALAFDIETVPYQGALQGTLPHLMYTPRPGFEGVDRFTFRARNAAGLSNLATITIMVAEPAPAQTGAEAQPDTDIATAAPEAPADAPAPIEETPPAAMAAPTAPAVEPALEPRIESTTEIDMPAAAPAEATELPSEPPAADLPAGEPASEIAAPTPPAAPAAAPSPEPPPSVDLPTDAAFTIQVRSVKEAAGAAKIVAQLREKGHAAFSQAVEVPDKGQWHRIYINGYPSLETAREALAKLDPDRFKGAFVRRMPAGMVPPAPPAETPQPAPAAAPEPISEPPALPAAEPESEADGERQAIAVSGTYPYAYQVKSYKQKEEAFQLGMELTTQGQRAFIGRGSMGSTGVWYRVYIGCYQTPEEAEKYRADIARIGFPEAFLTPIALAIAVTPDETDPAGETLENRLMASGFLPYRLPGERDSNPSIVMVGGFRHPDDAAQVLAALEQSGFKGKLKPR